MALPSGVVWKLREVALTVGLLSLFIGGAMLVLTLASDDGRSMSGRGLLGWALWVVVTGSLIQAGKDTNPF